MKLIIENIKKIKKYKVKRLGIFPIFYEEKPKTDEDISVSLIHLYLKQNNFMVINNVEGKNKIIKIIEHLSNNFNFPKIKKKNIFSIGRSGDTEILIFNLKKKKFITHCNYKHPEFNWCIYYNFFKNQENKYLHENVNRNNEMNTYYDYEIISDTKDDKIKISMYILIKKFFYINFNSKMNII